MVAGKHRKSMNAVHGLLGGPKIEEKFALHSLQG